MWRVTTKEMDRLQERLQREKLNIWLKQFEPHKIELSWEILLEYSPEVLRLPERA